MPRSVKQVVLLLSFLFPGMLLAQNTKTDNKIDLPFRILITQQKAADPIAQKKSPKPKTTRNKSRSTDTSQKKYDCTIYTKNPAVLRKKGIIVQTELPGFVTALATLQQIQWAATRPEVTFIKAPEYLQPHTN